MIGESVSMTKIIVDFVASQCLIKMMLATNMLVLPSIMVVSCEILGYIEEIMQIY